MTEKQNRILYLVLGFFLGISGVIHVFSTVHFWQEKSNALLRAMKEIDLDNSSAEKWDKIKKDQEETLAHHPSDPYGWTRLAFLRNITGEPSVRAFQALKIADAISPNEPRGLIERAFLWRQLYDPVDMQDRERLSQLWKKALYLQTRAVLVVAEDRKIAKEIWGILPPEDAETFRKWSGLQVN